MPGIRASRLPALDPTDGPGVVLLDVEPKRRQLARDPVGHAAFFAGRARDPAERLERAVQSLAFGLGDRDSIRPPARVRGHYPRRVAVTSSFCAERLDQRLVAPVRVGGADELPEQRRRAAPGGT